MTAPQRRSIRDRMGDSPLGTQPLVGDQHPLTDTTMTTIGGLSAFDTAFRVEHTGEITATAAAAVGTYVERSEDAAPLDLEVAQDHHLFVVGSAVRDEELEALAVSIRDEAGWAQPGTLRLAPGVFLRGPWTLDAPARQKLGVGADLTSAWVLDCPSARGSRPSPEDQERDEWARAFPEGMPYGIEYETLLVLQRMARRLAGAVRVAGSGYVIEPDPDSAVCLTLYSQRWCTPDDVLHALRPRFDDIVDSRDIRSSHEVRPSKRLREGEENLRRGAQRLSDAIREALTRDVRDAQMHPQVVDGYALLASVGNRSQMMVEVHQVPSPPPVLRWEPWGHSAAVEYRVRWLPQGAAEIAAQVTSRAARLERLRSTRDIENAAAILATLTDAFIVDEDGFLVSFDA